MFEVIYRLFEMMALVICLHSLSGEKVKLNIYNVGFIAIELTFMQMIQDEIVSNQMYFMVYLICFLYTYIKFKDTLRRTALKYLLATLIMGGLQIVVYIPMSFLNYIIPNESLIISLINALIFFILFLTRKSKKYANALEFCTSKDWIVRICFFACFAVLVFFMFSLKKNEVIETDIFVIISLFMAMFLVFIYRWRKSAYELDKKEREIEITNLYNGVFEELIESVRRRQHDFHNQIDAVYSSHLTSNSLEELIEKQKEYCDNIIYENRFSKVLSCIKNSTLSGFIYTKFTKAEQYGIEIEYDIAYTDNTEFSVYDLVDIIGILLDNAIEAVIENNVAKKILFQLIDYDGIKLCVKNPIVNISNNDIEKFFKDGYSTKDSGTGIGLSKIKEYQKKYKYNIYTRIIHETECDWIEFQIVKDK